MDDLTDFNTFSLFLFAQIVSHRKSQPLLQRPTFSALRIQENYAIFDAMGVPRTTEGTFKKDYEAPFSSEGMVTFGEAIRLGKMDSFTDDFKQLTGEEAITVKYMFEHADKFQVGERHSEDN